MPRARCRLRAGGARSRRPMWRGGGTRRARDAPEWRGDGAGVVQPVGASEPGQMVRQVALDVTWPTVPAEAEPDRGLAERGCASFGRASAPRRRGAAVETGLRDPTHHLSRFRTSGDATAPSAMRPRFTLRSWQHPHRISGDAARHGKRLRVRLALVEPAIAGLQLDGRMLDIEVAGQTRADIVEHFDRRDPVADDDVR